MSYRLTRALIRIKALPTIVVFYLVTYAVVNVLSTKQW